MKRRLRVDIWSSLIETAEKLAEEIGVTPQEAVNIALVQYCKQFAIVPLSTVDRIENKSEQKTQPINNTPEVKQTIEGFDFTADF